MNTVERNSEIPKKFGESGVIPQHRSVAHRSSNLRSSDFVINWFREILITFELIPIFDQKSEFFEMAEAMFNFSTYWSISFPRADTAVDPEPFLPKHKPQRSRPAGPSVLVRGVRTCISESVAGSKRSTNWMEWGVFKFFVYKSHGHKLH